MLLDDGYFMEISWCSWIFDGYVIDFGWFSFGFGLPPPWSWDVEIASSWPTLSRTRSSATSQAGRHEKRWTPSGRSPRVRSDPWSNDHGNSCLGATCNLYAIYICYICYIYAIYAICNNICIALYGNPLKKNDEKVKRFSVPLCYWGFSFLCFWDAN